MNFVSWIALSGGLFLMMALSSAYLPRLPVTSSGIYLALGWAIGRIGLGSIDFLTQKTVFEHLTEIAVILSLFVGGLKLRLPLSDPAWFASFRLAGPVMVGSIAGLAAFVHYGFGWTWGTALLLGSVLAPTDPVLAGRVAVSHAGDQDRMRYGLSGEAGFNDGAAFPFVVFSLLWMEHGGGGDWIGGWALHRLVWAIPAGLVLGFYLGKWVGRLAIVLRRRYPDSGAPGDFLALALIALAYAGAETCGAWGFLAVFAAGLGFRRSEVQVVQSHPAVASGEKHPHPPAEEFAHSRSEQGSVPHQTKTTGSLFAEILAFGDTAERLLEVMMVVLLGICLATYWDWRAIPLALVFFGLIRPACTLLFLKGTPTDLTQRWLMGWFGIRGIGSLYYLSYALTHGLSTQAAEIVGITLSVVALSIILHGLSNPLLEIYEKRFQRVHPRA